MAHSQALVAVVAAASLSVAPAHSVAIVGARTVVADPSRSKRQEYSTNAVCSKNHCLNPIFPGLQGLASLESTSLQCQRFHDVAPFMEFCKAAVDYDIALPMKEPGNSTSLDEVVRRQEIEAVTAYRYHLAAMNVDAWEHRRPEHSGNECVRSVWRLVCSTYFPQAAVGCRPGQPSGHLRPCRNACENYVSACKVECCDESAKCVFERPVNLSHSIARVLGDASETLTTSGYAAEFGPSAVCTGRAGGRGVAGVALALVLAVVAAMAPEATAFDGPRRPAVLSAVFLATASTLQGCDVIGHSAAAWENKPSYLTTFQFVPLRPEAKQEGVWQLPLSEAVMNSCELIGLPDEQRCSGRGVCRPFNGKSAFPKLAPLSFCQCDRDWADPECRTRRKSQAKAFFLSVFTGLVGGDRFYMGQFYVGMAKMVTLGGLGFWWILDIVYIGSAPVYAQEFRLAADLPHWMFVATSVTVAAAVGVFALNVYGEDRHRRKEKAKLLHQTEEEFFKSRSGAVDGVENHAGYGYGAVA